MKEWFPAKWRWSVLIGLFVFVVGTLPFVFAQINSERAFASKTSNQTLYLPLVLNSYAEPLCRLGVGTGSDVASYQVNSLMVGWYLDWNAANSARPGGIKYLPTIHISQVGSNGYSYSPNGSTLLNLIAANPGALWLVGNEPDRRYYQDSVEAGVYASAYGEIYNLIKGKDPTAQVAAGGIVEPTPLRLQYLDLVLQNYQAQNGKPMPVDVWNIHNYILPERSCNYYPDNCWGADVPTGLNVPKGMEYDIQDNDNLNIFEQNTEAFRQWMANRGYQNRPLIITEMGVQMPDRSDIVPLFTPSRVNAYMNNTFDYLQTKTSTLGYQNDNYHLVQRWAWYSLSDTNFNGWLFDPNTKARTVFGDNFAAYAARMQPSDCNNFR